MTRKYKKRKDDPFFCKQHGKMSPENFRLCKYKGRPDYYRCKLCTAAQKRAVNHYKERYKKVKGDGRFERARDLHRIARKKHINNLTDGIVKEYLRVRYGFNVKEIPAYLIELYRHIIKINRLKRKQNESNMDN